MVSWRTLTDGVTLTWLTSALPGSWPLWWQRSLHSPHSTTTATPSWQEAICTFIHCHFLLQWNIQCDCRVRGGSEENEDPKGRKVMRWDMKQTQQPLISPIGQPVFGFWILLLIFYPGQSEQSYRLLVARTTEPEQHKKTSQRCPLFVCRGILHLLSLLSSLYVCLISAGFYWPQRSHRRYWTDWREGNQSFINLSQQSMGEGRVTTQKNIHLKMHFVDQ